MPLTLEEWPKNIIFPQTLNAPIVPRANAEIINSAIV